jgi:hypothetical protein
MAVTIDSSILTAYYNAKAGVGLAASGAGSNTGAGKGKDPAITPPWSTDSKAPRASDLVKSVMAGARFIDPTAAKLDVDGASGDYKQLFGLYQGINALQGLASQISASGISEGEKARLRARFNEGMAEIAKYLDTAKFADFQLTQGTVAQKTTSASGIKADTQTYVTAPLFTGSISGLPKAFEGAVAFSMSVHTGGTTPTTKQVDFDLSEMGATPRTMSNVVIYMNDKLAAAGVKTRFANERIPGADKTAEINGKTRVIGQEPDSYALKVKGDSLETVTFVAPAKAPAVYLAGVSGRDTDKTDPTLQLTKLEAGSADVTGAGAVGKVFARDIDAGVSAVKAQTVAPDGSVYVLAEVDGAVSNQSIKGQADVALMKYDAAGNLLYTRTLGAASTASGYSLAVSADGASVAIAGSVTGVLDNGEAGKDANTADSFVTVFDAAGEEKWTQRSTATLADKATGVAFGADGSVYVTGSTSSSMTVGGAGTQGQDGYLRGYSATGKISFTTQFGTAGTDAPAGLVVDGNSVVVAGVENGQTVLRRYDLQPVGAPTLASTRNLGAMRGSLAGIGLADDGSIILAGTTTNGSLGSGMTTTTGYPGQQAAFVARLSADLSVQAGERMTYLAGTAARSAASMSISGGQVYLAGQVGVAPPPGETAAHDGYVQAVDPITGAVGWSRQFTGADKELNYAAVAVDADGASVLDRLGLPQGELDWEGSKTLVANSAARVGDQFVIRGASGAKTVTIEANDTLKTLADKIGRASGFVAKVETVTVDGVQKLRITALGKSEIEIEAGKTGRNALAALGLTEALITNDATKAADAKKAKTEPTYGLGLPSTLNLDTDAAAKQAEKLLVDAAMAVKAVYTDISKPVSTTAGKTGGTVPAYLSAQIANYQLALARLTGG